MDMINCERQSRTKRKQKCVKNLTLTIKLGVVRNRIFSFPFASVSFSFPPFDMRIFVPVFLFTFVSRPNFVLHKLYLICIVNDIVH